MKNQVSSIVDYATCPEIVLFDQMGKTVSFLRSLFKHQRDLNIAQREMFLFPEDTQIIYVCRNLVRFGITNPVVIQNGKAVRISDTAIKWYIERLDYVHKLNRDEITDLDKDLESWYEDFSIDLSKWGKNRNTTTSEVLSPKAT